MSHPMSRPAGSPSPLAVMLAGLAALAVAMGVGRFAFTPLLPLMLRDGVIDAALGAELATANYLGYLVGALSAARLGTRPLRLLRAALAGVVVLTLGAAVAQGRVPLWALRAAAGVCSAWVLVGVSSWCLRELALAGQAWRGAWVYTGVGVGIALAGGLAWAGGPWPSQQHWLTQGLLAAAGATLVLVALRRGAEAPAPPATAAAPIVAGPLRGQAALVACYGSFGFGYIVPATFLPALARQQVDDPRVFGLAWPVFGLAAAASVALAARWASRWPRRRVWALAQSVMGLGTAVLLWRQDLPVLVASAVMVGGTFMVATMAGLQWAREREPYAPTALLARMTAAFAAGQMAGPMLVRMLAGRTVLGLTPMDAATAAATVLLVATAAWLWLGD